MMRVSKEYRVETPEGMVLEVGRSVDSIVHRTQNASMEFRRDPQDGFK